MTGFLCLTFFFPKESKGEMGENPVSYRFSPTKDSGKDRSERRILKKCV